MSTVAVLVVSFMVLLATAHAFKATMTINSFEEGGDGGGASECDGKFHKNSERVVALSSHWYDGGKRCGNDIRIHANGHSVSAKVVDECDSHHGCRNNIVDASKAVWNALKIHGSDVGEYAVTWTDA